MEENHKFLKFVIIVAFSGSIVALGAHDLQRDYNLKKGRNVTVGSFFKDLRDSGGSMLGGVAQARSREEESPADDKSERAGGQKLPQDKLDKKDRAELGKLIDEVMP